MANEFRKNNIFSDHVLPANVRVPAVRQTIFGKLQNQELLMLGSVFGARKKVQGSSKEKPGGNFFSPGFNLSFSLL
jgi:hypothetical protein